MKLDGTDGNGKGEFEVDYSRETKVIMGEEGRDGFVKFGLCYELKTTRNQTKHSFLQTPRSYLGFLICLHIILTPKQNFHLFLLLSLLPLLFLFSGL